MLQKLKWRTVTDFRGITQLRINEFDFKIRQQMDQDTQYKLVEFIELHKDGYGRGILLIAVWLMQHDIKFDIKFKWCKSKSIRHNLRVLKMPENLKKLLTQYHDDFIALDVNNPTELN